MILSAGTLKKILIGGMKISKISRPWVKEESHRHNIRGDRSFYQTSAWRSLRNHHLQQHPWCVDCKKEGKNVKATVADHIIQVIADDSRKLDPNNLQSLCSSHHNSRSARQRNAMYNAGRK